MYLFIPNISFNFFSCFARDNIIQLYVRDIKRPRVQSSHWVGLALRFRFSELPIVSWAAVQQRDSSSSNYNLEETLVGFVTSVKNAAKPLSHPLNCRGIHTAIQGFNLFSVTYVSSRSHNPAISKPISKILIMLTHCLYWRSYTSLLWTFQQKI